MASKDQKLLYQLNFEDEQVLFIKISGTSVTTVPTKEEVEVRFCADKRSDWPTNRHSSRCGYIKTS